MSAVSESTGVYKRNAVSSTGILIASVDIDTVVNDSHVPPSAAVVVLAIPGMVQLPGSQGTPTDTAVSKPSSNVNTRGRVIANKRHQCWTPDMSQSG